MVSSRYPVVTKLAFDAWLHAAWPELVRTSNQPVWCWDMAALTRPEISFVNIAAARGIDLSALGKACGKINRVVFLLEPIPSVLKDLRDRDKVEGWAATLLWQSLQGVPLIVKEDSGFWRYVGTHCLLPFVIWREIQAFSSIEANKMQRARQYLDATLYSETVATRMYLRACIANRAGDLRIAYEADRATDLWRSHILRVRVSHYPHIAAALVRLWSELGRKGKKNRTAVIRELAKRINNHTLSQIEATASSEEAYEFVKRLVNEHSQNSREHTDQLLLK
ncbi:MAG: hypothetical protein KatS3mg008_1664 [Acidimicrobiales bacterium]|nr:MAG: hypothetical protein KatS3mg008_1664 [Acidimicrobiales bacterium]